MEAQIAIIKKQEKFLLLLNLDKWDEPTKLRANKNSQFCF